LRARPRMNGIGKWQETDGGECLGLPLERSQPTSQPVRLLPAPLAKWALDGWNWMEAERMGEGCLADFCLLCLASGAQRQWHGKWGWEWEKGWELGTGIGGWEEAEGHSTAGGRRTAGWPLRHSPAQPFLSLANPASPAMAMANMVGRIEETGGRTFGWMVGWLAVGELALSSAAEPPAVRCCCCCRCCWRLRWLPGKASSAFFFPPPGPAGFAGPAAAVCCYCCSVGCRGQEGGGGQPQL
jgi:hypothetical protein